MPEDRAEEPGSEPDATVGHSDAIEAAWLREGNRAHCGYNIHAVTDSRDGYILGGHLTPANRSDTGEFVEILNEIAPHHGSSIFVDKGYRGKMNRHVLMARGLTDGFTHKAARDSGLSRVEKAANQRIRSLRSKVERAFGTPKMSYVFFRTRCLSGDKKAACIWWRNQAS